MGPSLLKFEADLKFEALEQWRLVYKSPWSCWKKPQVAMQPTSQVGGRSKMELDQELLVMLLACGVTPSAQMAPVVMES